jgi:hypothetical protein
MRLPLFALAVALSASPAFADPSVSCVDRGEARDNVTRRGGSFVAVTPEQWQFLRGIYAMNPATPPGLPVGDGAVIARIPGDQGAIILFIDGSRACAPMAVPSELIEMLDQVGRGDIPHQSGAA